MKKAKLREDFEDGWQIKTVRLNKGMFMVEINKAWSSPKKTFWLWTIRNHCGEGRCVANGHSISLNSARKAILEWFSEHGEVV